MHVDRIIPLVMAIAAGMASTGGVVAAEQADVWHSKLWGEKGENWTPASRLPDVRFAGYGFGQQPLPEVEVVADVTDFGAKGDDDEDDTEAFLRAIDSAERGAVFVPPGRYVITRVLQIRKSGLVLRGAGRDKTTLFFPRSLTEIAKPSGIDPRSSSQGAPADMNPWSWTGGVIWVEGENLKRSEELAKVVQPAERGDRRLVLDDASGIVKGQAIRLLMWENKQSPGLIGEVYGRPRSGDDRIIRWWQGKCVDWMVRVAAVSGSTIELERPLRIPVRPQWSPQIHSFTPAVEEVGIEHLAIEFSGEPFRFHYGRGHNAVMFKGCAHSWIRDVSIIDADNAVFLESNTRHCTVDGLIVKTRRRTIIEGARGRRCATGHHLVEADGSQDCLITDFAFETIYVHDITMQSLANGNVFSNGRGVDINFDHHGEAPHDNVFTDIDVGEGSTIWESSGRGRAGGRETFWNIRAKRSVERMPSNWAQINWIAVEPAAEEITGGHDRWIERGDPLRLQPQDIHQAQRQWRAPAE